MAAYATYRHIELDNVGYGKKRINHSSSDIFAGSASPMPTSPNQTLYCSNITPLREQRTKSQRLSDSFTRLFGSSEPLPPSPPGSIKSEKSRGSLNRNPVTGDGVQTYDLPLNKNKNRKPKNPIKRNPVTGEGVPSPKSTATSPLSPQSPKSLTKSPNGNSGHVAAILNGNPEA